MHILIGADADYVVNDVVAALGGPDVSFTVCRNGRDVAWVVGRRTPDLAVLDLQIGSMGAMAVTMQLRLDESVDALPHVTVLMLLDRRADVHLAKRCGAEDWLIKPVDALTLKRTAGKLLREPAPVRRWKNLSVGAEASTAAEVAVAAAGATEPVDAEERAGAAG